MSGNTFGRLFTVTTFGESHGPALGCVVDGCPPGLELCEEDIQHDFYRPAMRMRVRAGLADQGRGAARLAGLDVTLSGALLSHWGKPPVAEPKPDPQLTGGLLTIPYALPDYRIRWVPLATHVPIGVWRSGTFYLRNSNSAGGTKEIYYSNGGELNLDTGKVSSNGGLAKAEAAAMKMPPNLLESFKLEGPSGGAVTAANTGSDPRGAMIQAFSCRMSWRMLADSRPANASSSMTSMLSVL